MAGLKPNGDRGTVNHHGMAQQWAVVQAMRRADAGCLCILKAVAA